jgi:hypothetical protein
MKLPRKLPPMPKEETTDILTMTKYELEKELTRKKVRNTEVITMMREMDLARLRESLLEKQLVEKQATFLLIAMRQKILNVPSTYARKVMHIDDIKTAHAVLQTIAHTLLNELKDLPKKIIDPKWLTTVEEEEE